MRFYRFFFCFKWILSWFAVLLTLYTWILTPAAWNVTHLAHQKTPGRFLLLLSSSLHHPYHLFHSLHPSFPHLCRCSVAILATGHPRAPWWGGGTSQETSLDTVNPDMKECGWLELRYRGQTPLMLLFTQATAQIQWGWGWGDNQCCQ